jgi:hypothetical protein
VAVLDRTGDSTGVAVWVNAVRGVRVEVAVRVGVTERRTEAARTIRGVGVEVGVQAIVAVRVRVAVAVRVRVGVCTGKPACTDPEAAGLNDDFGLMGLRTLGAGATATFRASFKKATVRATRCVMPNWPYGTKA